jgi:hypothetical protein
MKNYELVSKAKIELNLFQQFFTPHTPPLKQGESETTLSPDIPSTRIIRSTFLSVNSSNRAAQCQIS